MKTKKHIFISVIILVFVSIATMIGITVVADSMPNDETICDGIWIGSVNVSNMTKEEAQTAIEKHIEQLKEKTIQIEINGNVVETTVSQFGLTFQEKDSIKRALEAGKSGNLIKRYKEVRDIAEDGLFIDLQYVFNRLAIEAYLSSEECIQYNQYAQNAVCIKTEDGFEITDASIGSVMAVANTISLIEQAIIEQCNEKVIQVTAQMQIEEPEYTRQDVLECRDLLGSYTTSFKDSSASRASNLANGARLINRTMVYPGEVFSAYEALSPFTVANGYKAAGAYLDGKIVDSVGGGVCQLSTTLYNAVLQSELEIIERQPHSMIVSYVKPAMDAAIASTYKDLKFKNNTETPIYIEAITVNRTVTFNIYGKENRSSNRTIEFISEVVGKTQPGEDIITEDETKPIGYRKVTQKAHIGYKAYLYKVIYEDGVQVSKEEVNYSTYKAEPAYVTIGTMKILTPTPSPTVTPEE